LTKAKWAGFLVTVIEDFCWTHLCPWQGTSGGSYHSVSSLTRLSLCGLGAKGWFPTSISWALAVWEGFLKVLILLITTTTLLIAKV